MIVNQEGKYTVVELNDSDLRALRSLVSWAEMLENEGKLEIFTYQKEFMNRVKSEL